MHIFRIFGPLTGTLEHNNPHHQCRVCLIECGPSTPLPRPTMTFAPKLSLADSVCKLDVVSSNYILVTILSGATICFLLFFEWIDYQKVSWRSELVIDQTNTEQMTINFDISFPRVPCFGTCAYCLIIVPYCEALTLDLMDAADQHQNNVEKDILKTKLSSTGQSLGPYSGTRKMNGAIL